MNKSFLFRLNYLLTKKDKLITFVLFIMSFFLSILETIGIASIMPFISIVTNPSLIESNQYLASINVFFNINDSKKFILYFGVMLISFYIFRAAYTVFHGFLITSFVMKKFSYFANKLFFNFLNMEYTNYTLRNSGSLARAISSEASRLSSLLQYTLTIITEILTMTILYILLLMVNVKMTLVLTFIIIIKIILILLTISKKIKEKGKERVVLEDNIYRSMLESFNNFKMIKFIADKNNQMNTFKESINKYKKTHIINDTLVLLPRSILEALGLSILMIIVMYVALYKDNVNDVIPIVSMYALALYRVLPAVIRIMNSYNNIMFFVGSLDNVYNDLNMKLELEGTENIEFNEKITIENIKFSYNKKHKLLHDFNLEIKKGQNIAFVGSSGCGKSTLVDIICGIIKPSSGQILIDNKKLNKANVISWRKKIGYIPQSIYLFDGTIAENISFKREYNEEKIIEVLKKVNLYDVIMQKEGLDTIVGDGGIQLSGGQKQRVGIARALYGNPDILVLDEATSALDSDTEEAIMKEIYSLGRDKTLIIIAHRLSTIKDCDVIVDFNKI